MIKNKFNRLLILFIISVLFISCSMLKINKKSIFHKSENGIIPLSAYALIIKEEGDTVWTRLREIKMYGGFNENISGDYYFISRGKILYHCKIKNGILMGEVHAFRYSDGRLIRRGYLENGQYNGYVIEYYDSNYIYRIRIYCKSKRVGLWTYFDKNGNFLYAKNYGKLPDTCQIPNQYLYDSLPEKYKIEKIDSLVSCCVVKNKRMNNFKDTTSYKINKQSFNLIEDTNYTVFICTNYFFDSNNNCIKKTLFAFEVENKNCEKFEFINNEILKARAMHISTNGNNLKIDSIIYFSNECYIKGEKIKHDIWNIDVNVNLKKSESTNYIGFNKNLKFYPCKKEDNDYVPFLWE
ncbi:MAG TPA: hypothetical protein PLF32_02140 [Bacteroidales bacterium]|nr:hypothetical protein [Bacteroidales bacterium]HOR81440.1 hypothetical protein [Bacteroidales bacterium]HPJ90615.1 hypothetical protein [Bacteroidales bacterium]